MMIQRLLFPLEPVASGEPGIQRRKIMTRISPMGSGATGTGSTFTTALAAGVFRAIRKVVIAIRNRATVQKLQSLDDRMLKDIGLHRSDIDRVLLLPLNEDPSRHLAGFSGETPPVTLEKRPERRMLRPGTSLQALKPAGVA
jgi:uncharacterized protein YjiS (DUF1127 family)